MKILHVRRAAAILLLFAMLFSVMPFAAFADDTDIAGEQSEEVVESAETPTETQAEEPEEDAREISEDEEPVEAVVADATVHFSWIRILWM